MTRSYPSYFVIEGVPVKVCSVDEVRVMDPATGAMVLTTDYAGRVKAAEAVSRDEYLRQLHALRQPILERYATASLAWMSTGDGEMPYRCVVHGHELVIRLGDFPDEALYMLRIDGEEVYEIDDWPAAWTRGRSHWERAADAQPGIVPDSIATARTPSELLEEVLAEARDYEEFDSDMGSNPHNPWHRTEKLLAARELVPFLVEILKANGPGAPWAVYALKLIGPAARAASEILEQRDEVEALFSVDESRGRALGLHRGARPGTDGKSVRSVIAAHVLRSRDDDRVRAHFADLLRNLDPHVVRFALSVSRTDDAAWLDSHLREHPESAPLEELRALSSHHDPVIALGAAGLLAVVHLPEDAGLALDVFVKHGAGPPQLRSIPVAWLAPLPQSIALFDLDLAPEDLLALVQRRRCSGLAIPSARVRELAVRAIEEGDGAGARIVEELRDASLIDALLVRGLAPRKRSSDRARTAAGDDPATLDAVQNEESYPTADEARQMHQRTFQVTSGHEAIESALGVLGPAALSALRVVAASSPPRSLAATILASLTRYADRPPVEPTTAYADQLFAEGQLESSSASIPSAFGRYAAFLGERAHDAYAAYQLAWIDRAFGTPITELRLDWLAQLGVEASLLRALATRPGAIVSGIRSLVADGSARAPNAALAARAEAAGVPSVAAHYTADVAERQRLRAAATHHIDRVRRGCRA